jgi:hypothetical protein
VQEKREWEKERLRRKEEEKQKVGRMRDVRTTCPSTTEKSPVPSKGGGIGVPGTGGKVLYVP